MNLVTVSVPAKKILFCSDLHLDWSSVWNFHKAQRQFFYDALIISGDISTGADVHEKLAELHAAIGKPIVCVLGNHDFYDSSFEKVNKRMARFFPLDNGLVTRLDGSQIVQLSPSAAMVGVDGWGDGLAGNIELSNVEMQDWLHICELRKARREGKLFEWLRHLGRRSAQQLAPALTVALENYEQVFVLTHAPPFPEVCAFGSERDELLPFYCNTALGKLLAEAADRHPQCHITVLCGHTHRAVRRQYFPNLKVIVSGTTYGHPCPDRLLEIKCSSANNSSRY